MLGFWCFVLGKHGCISGRGGCSCSKWVGKGVEALLVEGEQEGGRRGCYTNYYRASDGVISDVCFSFLSPFFHILFVCRCLNTVLWFGVFDYSSILYYF